MEIKYSYAKDADGKLVHIDETLPGAVYYCAVCGNEMIAKKGDINAHHFAHKVECSCNGESYLHKIAKEKFKEVYDRSSEFFLEYKVPVECPLHKDTATCMFANKYCNSVETTKRQLDLKKVFDRCLIEAPVDDGRFYADILLRSSSANTGKSLMVEFYHTHKCEPEKINSGYPIVEIRIGSEDDIITSNRIAFSNKITLYGFKTRQYQGNELLLACFKDETDASDLKITRANCRDLLGMNCNDFYGYDDAFAVAIDPLSYYTFSMGPRFKNPPTIGEVACAVAYSRGFGKFENCDVCVFSRRSQYNKEELWCTESKNDPQLPRNPKNMRAWQCRHSYPNMKRIRYIAKYINELDYMVLRCNPPAESYD